MSERKVIRSYQKISDNVYRISGTVRRDAVTGRFITDGSYSRSTKKNSSAASGQR